MKYTQLLIDASRADTNNTDFSSTNGITTEDFIRYLNFGQERLQSLILQQNPQSFQKEIIINVVNGQAKYTIPDNVFMGERIVNVEFSSTGDERNYYKLKERGIYYRLNSLVQNSSEYIRQNGAIILQPTPQNSSAKLRVVYERQLDSIDLRRGQISNIALSGNNITSITLNTSTVNSDNATALNKAEYVCVNTFIGEVTLYAIPVNGYNSSTGVLTIRNSSFPIPSGQSISVNNYISIGEYSTTHSKLQNICERYLICYCNWKIAGRDSATGSKFKIFEDELNSIEDELIKNYQQADKDMDYIQIADPSLIIGR